MKGSLCGLSGEKTRSEFERYYFERYYIVRESDADITESPGKIEEGRRESAGKLAKPSATGSNRGFPVAVARAG
jgi:hypothetical protein